MAKVVDFFLLCCSWQSSSSGVPYSRCVIPGVYRNVNVFLQSTCLQQFWFMSSELSWAILSQTVWLIWCIPLSEGGDKSRAASRNCSFLKPMDVEVTAAFKSYVLSSSTSSSSWFMYLLKEFKERHNKAAIHTPQWLCHNNSSLFFFGRLKLGPGAVV